MSDMSVLTRWIGSGQPTEELPDLGALKSALSLHGVNSRGWRLYLDHGNAMFNPLRKAWLDRLPPSQQASTAIAWLRVVQACEMDVLPPVELVASISDWGLGRDGLGTIPPLFLRAAWKATSQASYAGTDVNAFIHTEVVPLAKWFFQSGTAKSIDAGRLKAGWESLKRLRRDSVAVKARQLSADDWPAVVKRFESGAFRMHELCNASELQDEGEAMDHCVGGFADTCKYTPVRIFSIRIKKTGRRVATLAIKETRKGHWDVDQLKGPGNADPGSGLWEDIDALLRVVTDVTRRNARLRQFLDFLHTLGHHR